jgi:hypothetical protein
MLAPTARLAVRKELLFCPLTISRPVGVQPQGDVGRLHRLPYRPYQIIAECAQVCFVAQLGREGFQGLSGVVLAAVEATVDKALNSPPERGKQSRDQEG